MSKSTRPSFGQALPRRRFLKTSAAALAAPAILPSRAFANEELNILVWCDHADPKLIDPFAEQFGVTVNVKTYEGTGTAISLLEQSGEGEWDVLVVDAPDVPQVAELGYLAELPEDIAPWGEIFPQLTNAPWSKTDGKIYAVPEKFGYYGFCFNKEAVSVEDARRGDIAWNSDYAGRIAVYDYYFPVMQMIGISMGKTPAELTSADLPEIRERLLAMKPNVKLVGDIVGVQNALVTGSVDVIVGGAEFAVSGLVPTNPNLDWVISDQGGLIWNQGIGIVSGSGRPELATEFIKYILSPGGQAALATSDCFWAMPANSAATLTPEQKTILRWDEQPEYLAKSQFSLLPDADMDFQMLDIWTEFLQS